MAYNCLDHLVKPPGGISLVTTFRILGAEKKSLVYPVQMWSTMDLSPHQITGPCVFEMGETFSTLS